MDIYKISMAGVSEPQRFLTVFEQKLIKTIYDQDYVTFHSQKVYRDRKTFNHSIRFLCDCGFLKPKAILKDRVFITVYCLTWDGVLLWEEFLKRLK